MGVVLIGCRPVSCPITTRKCLDRNPINSIKFSPGGTFSDLDGQGILDEWAACVLASRRPRGVE